MNPPLYESPRFSVTEDGRIQVTLHTNDNVEESIAALVDLGDAMQVAADLAERAVRAEGIGTPFQQVVKVKRIRAAMGFAY